MPKTRKNFKSEHLTITGPTTHDKPLITIVKLTHMNRFYLLIQPKTVYIRIDSLMKHRLWKRQRNYLFFTNRNELHKRIIAFYILKNTSYQKTYYRHKILQMYTKLIVST